MYLHVFGTVKGIIAVKGQVVNGHISGVPHACPCHLEPCEVFHGDSPSSNIVSVMRRSCP